MKNFEMNRKKLIIISDERFIENYIIDSILPSNIKNVCLITNKINPKIKKILKYNKIKFQFYVLKQLGVRWFKKNIDIKNSLMISAGSSWIIKPDIIKLFKNNILNLHQSPLPSLRGAVASYVRLYGIKSLQVCLHVVKEKIDVGEIVFSKNVFISKEIDTPIKIHNFLQKCNRELLKDFLISYFVKKKKLTYNKQNEFFSSYMPRLKTEINGWIDWSSHVYELERFIGAFDEPYTGSKTMLHGKPVSLLNVQHSCMEASKHPFENGMVLRKFMDMIVVSVKGGSLYVKKVIYKDQDIKNKIRPGDIFYTPINKLDLTKRKNIFISKDKKIYDQKKNKVKLL